MVHTARTGLTMAGHTLPHVLPMGLIVTYPWTVSDGPTQQEQA